MHLSGIALLLLAAVFPSAQAEDCSGHGTLQDGQCVCTSPLPQAGTSGWVGAQCEQEVKLLPVDGGALDHNLEPGTTACWAASLAGMTTQPHYFAASITLAAGSTTGVRLYGMLAADLASISTTGPAKQVYPHHPPGEGPWDYLMEADPAHAPHQVLRLEGAAVTAVQQQGLYLCTTNAAGAPAVSFTLHAACHSCPLTLHDNGFVSICSSTPEDVRYASDSCPAGICSCLGKYSRPASPVDYDLGFDDCSAVVESIPDATGPEPVSMTVDSHDPHSWHYFNFTVTEAHKHIALTATATKNTSSRVFMNLRSLQPPGTTSDAYTARSDWADFRGDLALSLQVGPGLPWPTLSPGLWYVGLDVWGDEAASYTLTLRRSACAGFGTDCSGRGTCDTNTGTCNCTAAGAVGADCSNSLAALTVGTPLSVPPRTFSADTLTVTGLDQLMATPTVALNIKAQFNTKDALPGWVTARPLLLVAPGHPDLNNPLTPDNAPHKLVLEQPTTDYHLVLDSSQAQSGELYMVFWNVLSTPYEVGYIVTAELQGRCLDDCSGHGQCQADGRCACQDGWLGASCSVDASARNGTDTCQPGSRMPVRKEEQKATCWAACNAETGKFDTDHCIDFTCDPSSADGRPQRRAGTQETCVVDLCSPAAGPNVTLTDPSGKFVCDRQCTCPADGGACAPEAACLPGSIRCLDGLVLTTGEDGSPQCTQPAPSTGCEEGSLKMSMAIPGGTAYAVCVCASAGQQCAWTAPSAAGIDEHGGQLQPSEGVVACEQGYQVVNTQADGLPLSDGRKLTSGGGCEKISNKHKGTSGGMVFFWCLFSVFLAAALVVGSRRASEWYEARRWSLGNDDELRVGLLDRVRMGVANLVTRRGGGGGGNRSSALDNQW